MQPVAIRVRDSSHISAARIAIGKLAAALDFDDTRAGRAALVATEAVSNMVRHADGGTFAARTLERDGAFGIEMLAIDSGPGMASFESSARDGYSTGSTAGTGLGAIGRLSDEFEANTEPGAGTILRSVVWNRSAARPEGEYEIGAIVVPKEGETCSGDAWTASLDGGTATLLVADGLGHGPDASRAAALATEVVHTHPGAAAARLLEIAHGRLRSTRGAAVAVIRREAGSNDASFAGIGNISACIIDGPRRQAMVSHNGIVGHNLHRIQEFRYEWRPGALLVAHSDGLESRWDLAQHPGLLRCHASIIAAMLYRRHARGRDDVVVLAVKAL